MTDAPLVSVVDDDPSVRKALRRLCKSAGYRVELYDSSESFLGANVVDSTSCLGNARSGESTSAPNQFGIRTFVAFTRVFEPHAEGESDKVRKLLQPHRLGPSSRNSDDQSPKKSSRKT